VVVCSCFTNDSNDELQTMTKPVQISIQQVLVHQILLKLIRQTWNSALLHQTCGASHCHGKSRCIARWQQVFLLRSLVYPLRTCGMSIECISFASDSLRVCSVAVQVVANVLPKALNQVRDPNIFFDISLRSLHIEKWK
jgi:hypothetical protein